MTPDEIAEIKAWQQTSSPSIGSQPQMGVFERSAKNLANVPIAGVQNLFEGVLGLMASGTGPYDTQEVRFFDVPRAQTGDVAGKVSDFLLRDVAPELASLAIPQAAVARASAAAKLSPFASNLAGDVAAGLTQAGRTGDPTAPLEFASFSPLRAVPSFAGRALGGAGMSASWSALKGQDLTDPATMAQIAAEGLFTGIDTLPRQQQPRMDFIVDPEQGRLPGRPTYPALPARPQFPMLPAPQRGFQMGEGASIPLRNFTMREGSASSFTGGTQLTGPGFPQQPLPLPSSSWPARESAVAMQNAWDMEARVRQSPVGRELLARQLSGREIPKPSAPIASTALRFGENVIPGHAFEPHADITPRAIERFIEDPAFDPGKMEYGFLDESGNFLSRAEAESSARRFGQLPQDYKTRQVGMQSQDLISPAPARSAQAAPTTQERVLFQREEPQQQGRTLALTTPEQLVNNPRNLEIARTMANRIVSRSGGRLDRADAESEAMMALWDAAQRYDPSRGNFENFAASAVKNRLNSFLRKERPRIERQESMVGSEGETRDFPASETSRPREEGLDLFMRSIPEQDRIILERHAEGFTFAETARELGVSRQAVEQKTKRLLKQARTAIETGKYDPPPAYQRIAKGSEVEDIPAQASDYGRKMSDAEAENLDTERIRLDEEQSRAEAMNDAEGMARAKQKEDFARRAQRQKRSGDSDQNLYFADPLGARVTEHMKRGWERFKRKYTGLMRDAATKEVLTRRSGFIYRFNKALTDIVDEYDVVRLASEATPGVKRAARDFIKGKASLNSVARAGASPEYVKAIAEMRSLATDLQRSVMKGESSPKRINMIKNTLDEYVARNYDIFTNPKEWTVDQKAFDDVVQEMLDYDIAMAARAARDKRIKYKIKYAQNREAAEIRLRSILEEYKAADKAFGGFAGDTIGINQKLYTHRMLTPEEKSAKINDLLSQKNGDPKHDADIDDKIDALRETPVLSDSFRKLLGEQTDPIEAMARTIHKLAASAANAETLVSLKDVNIGGVKAAMTEGEWSAALKKHAAGTPEGDRLRKYQILQGKQFGVMDGQMVEPDVKQAVHEVYDEWNKVMRGLERFIGEANSQIKQNFLTRNPATQLRNFYTSPMFVFMSGAPVRGFLSDALRSLAKSSTGKPNPVGWVKDFAENKGYAAEARNNGAIGADIVSQELTHDALKKIALNKYGSSKPPVIQKGVDAAVKVDDWLKKTYQLPDQLVRYYVYQTYRKQGLSESAALRKLDRYTHNYGNLPKGIRVLRNMPFVNPFISYNYEMARVMFNLAQDAANKNLSAKERVSAGLRFASVVSYPLAIKTAAEFLLTDEEREDWIRTRRMLGEYEQSRIQVPIKRLKDGRWLKINISPFSIAGDHSEILNAIFEGNWGALASNNPIVGIENTPIFNALAEQIAGRTTFGGERVKTLEERLQSVGSNLLPPLLGGSATRELRRSFQENREGGLGVTDSLTGREYNPGYFALGQAGFRVSQVDPNFLQRSAQMDYQQDIRDARRALNRVARTDASQEAITEARERFQRDAADARARLFRRVGSPGE